MANQPYRTRMAPSPTGEMHVGSMAIVLKNYALAKRTGGQFILRIEDTDQTRLVPGTTQSIQDVIHAYGLDWDEGPQRPGKYGPYIQSERKELYPKFAKQLVDEGKAYHCFCTKERLDAVRDELRQKKLPPRYDRHCANLEKTKVEQRIADGEPSVIRFKVPDVGAITFNDEIRGPITFQSSEIDDFVLLKSDGFPTYHLAVVIDDNAMKITHVLRGEEWISSAPKHVLLYQAFDWELPIFAHIPVFLNPDGKGKMSKRKGTVSAQSFLDAGYLPEALLNFFMILGWTPKDQRDLVSLEEYVNEFRLADLSKNSVVFDIDKLKWLNGQYIRKLPVAELKNKLKPFIPEDMPTVLLDATLPLVLERLETLADFDTLTAFFHRAIEHDTQLLLKKADEALVAEQLTVTVQALEQVSSWETDAIEAVIRGLQEEHDWKKGQYFMMLRIASTGLKATPPLFETITVIGKKMTLQRLLAAQSLVSK